MYMRSLEKCKAAQSVHINSRLVDTFKCQHMNRLCKFRIAFIFLTAVFDSNAGKFAFVSMAVAGHVHVHVCNALKALKRFEWLVLSPLDGGLPVTSTFNSCLFSPQGIQILRRYQAFLPVWLPQNTDLKKLMADLRKLFQTWHQPLRCLSKWQVSRTI